MARKGKRPDRADPGQRVKGSAAPRKSATEAPRADCTAGSATPAAKNRRATLAVCGFLLLGVALVFAQTAGHEFINFDDDPYVYKNFQVLRGLTAEGLAGAFTHSHAHNWHPLTTISHMLDCQWYGLWAGGHHLTNVLLHMATSIGLFLVLLQMTAAFWRSALVAAIFAIHPLRVESVAWIAERKDVLSGLCFMLTLAAYRAYARRPFSWARYLLMAVCFACGLMAKPMLVTLPLLLLLLDYWPLRRLAARRTDGETCSASPPLRVLVAEKIPLLLLAGISSWLTLRAQGWAVRANEGVPWGLRIGNALTAYASYLGQIFWPAGLAVPYPYPVDGLPIGKVAVSLGVLLGVSAGVLIGFRSRPYLLVGWLWFLGTLVPVIGFIQTGDQAMADRYTYLAQIGVYVALVWLAADLTGAWRYRRPGWGLAAVIVIAALVACSWRQTAYWRTSETLFTHTLACTQQNCPAHNNLGLALESRGDVEDAVSEYITALRINPRFTEAHVNLGAILAARGNLDEAMTHYRQALESNPLSVPAWSNLGGALRRKGHLEEAIADCRKALELDPLYISACNNLGSALSQQGHFEEGIEQFRKVLTLSPADAEAYHNLGMAYDQQGRANEAAGFYRKAIELDPRDAESHYNLGVIDYRQGRVDDAVAHYREVLKIDPRHLSAHNNMGGILYQQGKTEEAITHFSEAAKLDPRNGEVHSNLGSVLCRQGRFAEALAEWRTAIRLQPDSVGTLNAAAQLLATASDASLRNGAEALEMARRAVDLSHGRDPVILETLAAANAESGRIGEAVRIAEQARDLAVAQNDQPLAEAIAARLKCYRAGVPFHRAR